MARGPFEQDRPDDDAYVHRQKNKLPPPMLPPSASKHKLGGPSTSTPTLAPEISTLLLIPRARCSGYLVDDREPHARFVEARRGPPRHGRWKNTTDQKQNEAGVLLSISLFPPSIAPFTIPCCYKLSSRSAKFHEDACARPRCWCFHRTPFVPSTVLLDGTGMFYAKARSLEKPARQELGSTT